MDSVHIEMYIFSASIDLSDDDDDSALKVGLPTRVQMNSTKESMTMTRSADDNDTFEKGRHTVSTLPYGLEWEGRNLNKKSLLI